MIALRWCGPAADNCYQSEYRTACRLSCVFSRTRRSTACLLHSSEPRRTNEHELNTPARRTQLHTERELLRVWTIISDTTVRQIINYIQLQGETLQNTIAFLKRFSPLYSFTTENGGYSYDIFKLLNTGVNLATGQSGPSSNNNFVD